MVNNIQKIIREKNITQQDLAKMIGVRLEYINLIIHCKVTPTVPLASHIATALEVPVEDLFIIDN